MLVVLQARHGARAVRLFLGACVHVGVAAARLAQLAAASSGTCVSLLLFRLAAAGPDFHMPLSTETRSRMDGDQAGGGDHAAGADDSKRRNLGDGLSLPARSPSELVEEEVDAFIADLFGSGDAAALPPVGQDAAAARGRGGRGGRAAGAAGEGRGRGRGKAQKANVPAEQEWAGR